jgi:hypothetical protein
LCDRGFSKLKMIINNEILGLSLVTLDIGVGASGPLSMATK